MPEYPDIRVYVERLNAIVSGQRMHQVRLLTPFLLRTAIPPIDTLSELELTAVHSIGKRIVFVFEKELFLVLHLMVAGRLQWREPKAKIPSRGGVAALEFSHGTLVITEASTKKRASLHLVEGRDALRDFDRGGIQVLENSLEVFTERLILENHTLKRALTDPRLFSGIGNAYSDEILHRAGLSPMLLTSRMTPEQVSTLYRAIHEVLIEWTDRLRAEVGEGFPTKVTAFRKEMAVHGRYGQACPTCGVTVQRIRYAANETNYCPACQTGGRLLADRALSRLLKSDWPKTPEELEELRIKPPDSKPTSNR